MDHHARLAWAHHHLDRLKAECDAFAESNPYATAFHYDARRDLWVARIVEPKPLPRHWSLIIGDIVHNMRSALDNLAYALAMSHSPRRSPWNSQFPIYTGPQEFEAKRAQYIGGMDIHTQAIIEGLQEYRRDYGLEGSPLTILNHLSNVEKHRHVLIAAATGALTSWTVGEDTIDFPANRLAAPRTPIVHGTIVGEFKLPRKTLDPNVNVQGNFSMDVAFFEKGPADGVSVFAGLERIHNFIGGEVFADLDPSL